MLTFWSSNEWSRYLNTNGSRSTKANICVRKLTTFDNIWSFITFILFQRYHSIIKTNSICYYTFICRSPPSHLGRNKHIILLSFNVLVINHLLLYFNILNLRFIISFPSSLVSTISRLSQLPTVIFIRKSFSLFIGTFITILIIAKVRLWFNSYTRTSAMLNFFFYFLFLFFAILSIFFIFN